MLGIFGVLFIVLGIVFLKKAGKGKKITTNPLEDGYREITADIIKIEKVTENVKHSSNLENRPYIDGKIYFQRPVYRFVFNGQETEYTDTERELVPESAVGSSLKIYVRKNYDTGKLEVITKEGNTSNRRFGTVFIVIGAVMLIVQLLATFV